MKFDYKKPVTNLLAWAGSIAFLLFLFSPDADAAPEKSAGDETLSSAGTTAAPSKIYSAEDGWLDISAFIDQAYGFVPIIIPITEPAVGYGAAGAVAFIDKPKGNAAAGFGRPNITAVGGLGTENGTWGTFGGDVRHWLDDKLQTQVGLVYASVNLDFYGIGETSILKNNPLRYNLEPAGGVVKARYRLGSTRAWAGLSYAFANTPVTFDAPEATPGLPDFKSESRVGGVTPSLSYDSRDNVFTPLRGTYFEGSAGLFSQALGGDSEFQRVYLDAIQLVPISRKLTLGVRCGATFSFDDVPFYMRPYIVLRGAPAMRYQGDDEAEIEAELRWQLWKRFSLVGFAGTGGAWNDLERFSNNVTIVTGGGGFRYELARKYGLHMGVDLAFGPDDPIIYVQFGSAWMRP
jgi:outer membrane protein assembly factor BamA